MVLLVYALANLWQDEGGLIAVNVLISLLQIFIPAAGFFSLYFNNRHIALARFGPIGLANSGISCDFTFGDTTHNSFVQTFRSGVTRQELLFIGWIAPSSIVCAAVSKIHPLKP